MGGCPAMNDLTVRDQLVSAAEVLFAERGIDGVSLREINAAAGSRNASALQYHFGNRSGLIAAVLAKHGPQVEARRHALLDQYESDHSAGLRVLAAAYVRPLAAELDDPDGGPGYLQVLADLVNRPAPAISQASVEDPTDSTYRWRALVAPLLSPEALRLHRRFATIQFTLTELARRGRADRTTDHRLFTSDLVDLVCGLLSAPTSEETRRLASARGPRGPQASS